MAKDILGNEISDTCISISKEQYEGLIRESETMRILIEYIRSERIVTVSTIKVLLGISNEAEDNGNG